MQPLFQAVLTRRDLGTYLDIVMAPQPLGLSGPMAWGHLMTIGTQDRRLDTFSSPEDEQPPAVAILLQFPCKQYHKWDYEVDR